MHKLVAFFVRQSSYLCVIHNYMDMRYVVCLQSVHFSGVEEETTRKEVSKRNN